MANRITTLFDLDSKGFETGLKALRTKISETDGAFNKLKVAGVGALQALGPMAGFAAISIGTTLVAASLKAEAAFVNMSKAALDASRATGLDVESASRWIAVAEDMRVGADQLTTGFGRITKTLDSGKWEKYGVATRDAGGQARDVNAILLDTFDMLSKTTDETERARIGNDLFGRGFANIAPLVGKTRAEYEGMLAAVEDGQVITADEAKKAEATRLAFDKLHDSVQELGLAAGQLLSPALADMASDLADVATAAQTAAEKINNIPGVSTASKIFGFTNPVTGVLNVYKAGIKQIQDLWGTSGNPWLSGQAIAGPGPSSGGTPRGGAAIAAESDAMAAHAAVMEGRYVGALARARDVDEDVAAAAEATAKAEQAAADALARRQAGLHDYERAQLDVGDAEARLADARDKQNQLLTEGKVSAAEKAAADRDIATAAHDLLDAQTDLNRVVASSVPTDEDKARAVRRVADAQRDLEDAMHGVVSAQHQVEQGERRLADLKDDLDQLAYTTQSDAMRESERFKQIQKQVEYDRKRSDLIDSIADAEYDLTEAHRGVDDATRKVTDSQDKLNDATTDQQSLWRNGINVDDQKRGALDRVADAEARLAAAQQARTQLTIDSIPTDAEKAQATRDVERAQLDVVTALEAQSAAFAAQKGAADDSTASLALQRQELQRIIDMQPELANALQPNIDLLNARGGGPVYSQVPSDARGDGPNVLVQFNGVVGDPAAVGRQVVDATNAWYRAGGYGTINPFALTGPR